MRIQVHGVGGDQELDRVETFSDGELFALWQEQFRGRYGAQYLRDEELDVISSAMNQPMSIHVETNTDRIPMPNFLVTMDVTIKEYLRYMHIINHIKVGNMDHDLTDLDFIYNDMSSKGVSNTKELLPIYAGKIHDLLIQYSKITSQEIDNLELLQQGEECNTDIIDTVRQVLGRISMPEEIHIHHIDRPSYKHYERMISEGDRYVAKNTIGDGNCGLHAVFGKSRRGQYQISQARWQEVKERISSLNYEEIKDCPCVMMLMQGIKNNIDSTDTRTHLKNNRLSYGSYVRMLNEILSHPRQERYKTLISQRTQQDRYPHRLGCSIDALTRLRHYHQKNQHDVRYSPNISKQARHYDDFATYLLTQSLLGSTNINPNEGEGLLQSLMDTKADWGQLSQAVIDKERGEFLSDAIRFMYFRSTSPEPSDKTAKEGQPSDKLQKHEEKYLNVFLDRLSPYQRNVMVGCFKQEMFSLVLPFMCSVDRKQEEVLSTQQKIIVERKGDDVYIDLCLDVTGVTFSSEEIINNLVQEDLVHEPDDDMSHTLMLGEKGFVISNDKNRCSEPMQSFQCRFKLSKDHIRLCGINRSISSKMNEFLGQFKNKDLRNDIANKFIIERRTLRNDLHAIDAMMTSNDSEYFEDIRDDQINVVKSSNLLTYWVDIKQTLPELFQRQSWEAVLKPTQSSGSWSIFAAISSNIYSWLFSKSDGQDAVSSGNTIDGSPAQVNWIEEQIKTFEGSMDHSDPDLLSLRMEKMIACLNKIRVLSQLTEQDYYDINQQHDNPQSGDKAHNTQAYQREMLSLMIQLKLVANKGLGFTLGHLDEYLDEETFIILKGIIEDQTESKSHSGVDKLGDRETKSHNARTDHFAHMTAKLAIYQEIYKEADNHIKVVNNTIKAVNTEFGLNLDNLDDTEDTDIVLSKLEEIQTSLKEVELDDSNSDSAIKQEEYQKLIMECIEDINNKKDGHSSSYEA